MSVSKWKKPCPGLNVLASIALTLTFSVSVQSHSAVHTNVGQLIDAGDHHIEFIGGPADSTVIFVITDRAEEPVTLNISSAAVYVDDTRGNLTVPVILLEPNWLGAQLPRPLAKGSVVRLVAILSEGVSIHASFVAK